MPIEVGIWRIDNKLERIRFSALDSEDRLEAILTENINILDPGLMIIGNQVSTAFGKFIDLLAIDAQGDLTVLELKRNRTPRDVVAQVLDYASWVGGLSYEDITRIFEDKHQAARFEQAFSEQFGSDPPERLNENHRLVIVATELDSSSERIIGYLSENFGVPINVVYFRYFKDGTQEYLTRSWLIDPYRVDAQASKATAKKRGGKEAWNGRDWYVSVGESGVRTWADCRKYGFISAGQGKWYSGTLHLLSPGARIFTCVPKNGYVGIGIVKEPAVPVREFTVRTDGKETPILSLPLRAQHMDKNADDRDLCEYVVRVEWIKTRAVEEAVWEKGMFANQNSACKLRNRFTIEGLTEHFGLEDDSFNETER